MSISCYEIKQDLKDLITNIIGDEKTLVESVSPAESPRANSLIFLNQEKHLQEVLKSPVSAIVTTPQLAKKIQEISLDLKKTILVSPNVYLSMALTLQKFFPEKKELAPSIHPTAFIAKSAQISPLAFVGPYCVVGEGSIIQDRVRLESHVVVEENVIVGEGSHIFPQVYLGPRTLIGKNCEVKANSVIGGEGFGFAPDPQGQYHRIPQKGRVVLEDSVFIGSLCSIDRAALEGGETHIGTGTKIDNHIQIAHNVKVGKHCALAGGTMIAGSATIGNHCVIGGHSSIAGHLTICDKVQIGGRSGVSGSIEKPGAYAGHPLQPLRDHLKTEAYIKKLPELSKSHKQLLKKIEESN